MGKRRTKNCKDPLKLRRKKDSATGKSGPSTVKPLLHKGGTKKTEKKNPSWKMNGQGGKPRIREKLRTWSRFGNQRKKQQRKLVCTRKNRSPKKKRRRASETVLTGVGPRHEKGAPLNNDETQNRGGKKIGRAIHERWTQFLPF